METSNGWHQAELLMDSRMIGDANGKQQVDN